MSALSQVQLWSKPGDPPVLRDALAQAAAAKDRGYPEIGSEWLLYAAELVAGEDLARAHELERTATEVARMHRRDSGVVRTMVETLELPEAAPLPDEAPLPLLTPIDEASRSAAEDVEGEFVEAEEIVDGDDEITQLRHIPMPAIEDPQSEIGVTSLRVAVVADRARGTLVCRPLGPDEDEPGHAVAMLVAPTSFDGFRLAQLLDELDHG